MTIKQRYESLCPTDARNFRKAIQNAYGCSRQQSYNIINEPKQREEFLDALLKSFGK